MPPLPLPLLLAPAGGLLPGTPLDCAKVGVAKPSIAAAAIAPTAALENKTDFFDDIALLPWLSPPRNPQSATSRIGKGSRRDGGERNRPVKRKAAARHSDGGAKQRMPGRRAVGPVPVQELGTVEEIALSTIAFGVA